MADTTYGCALSALSERLSRYNISQTGRIERDICRAVIEAIREPDREMIDRGREVGPDAPYGAHETFEKWTTMVDAMIAQAPADVPRQPPRPSSTVAVFDPR